VQCTGAPISEDMSHAIRAPGEGLRAWWISHGSMGVSPLRGELEMGLGMGGLDHPRPLSEVGR